MKKPKEEYGNLFDLDVGADEERTHAEESETQRSISEAIEREITALAAKRGRKKSHNLPRPELSKRNKDEIDGVTLRDSREYPEPLNIFPISVIAGKLSGGKKERFFEDFRTQARILHSLTLQFFQTCITPKINVGELFREIHPELENFRRKYGIRRDDPDGKAVLDVYRELLLKSRIKEKIRPMSVIKIPMDTLIKNLEGVMGTRLVGNGEGERGRIREIIRFFRKVQDTASIVYEEAVVDEKDIDEKGLPAIRREAGIVKLLPKFAIRASKTIPEDIDLKKIIEGGAELPERIERSWIEEIHLHYDPDFFIPMVNIGMESILLHTDLISRYRHSQTWRLSHLVEMMASENSESLKENGYAEVKFPYEKLESFFRSKFTPRSHIITKLLAKISKEYNALTGDDEGYRIEIEPYKEKGVRGRGYSGAKIRIALNFPGRFFVKPSFSLHEFIAAKIHFSPTVEPEQKKRIRETARKLKETFPEDEIYGAGDYLLDRMVLESIGITPGDYYKESLIRDIQDLYHIELDAYKKLRQFFVGKHSWFEKCGYEICDIHLGIINRKTKEMVNFGGGDYSFRSALIHYYLSVEGKVPANYVDLCPAIKKGV